MAEFEKRVRKLLTEAGWAKVRQGSKKGHEIWGPGGDSGKKVPVPVKIKSRHTANEILKQAGLRKSF